MSALTAARLVVEASLRAPTNHGRRGAVVALGCGALVLDVLADEDGSGSIDGSLPNRSCSAVCALVFLGAVVSTLPRLPPRRARRICGWPGSPWPPS